jgi:hypothetical protein
VLTTSTTVHRLDLLAAAARVAAAATPRRSVTLRDEFGPIRGRSFLSTPTSITRREDLHGRRESGRSNVAWQLAA